MNTHTWKRLALWSCFAAAPIMFPMSPAFATMPGKTASHNATFPDTCLDSIFYGPLPGKTNYCLGLHDWKDGHYDTALSFFKLAAGWGNKNAQYTLGLIYFGGRHVATDPALGIAWLKLADQRQNDSQIDMVTRSAIKWSTPTQRHHAMELYQHMLPTFGDKVAANRAWHHLRHWERSNRNTDGQLCLYGEQRWIAMQLLHGQISDTSGNQKSGSSAGAPCVGVSLQAQHQLVHISANNYFSGFIGVVTVGPLQPVPATASSSGK